MTRVDLVRRRLAAASALALLAPWLPAARAATRRARVVVVGGGFAGATCARILRRLAPELSICVIDDQPDMITGPMSNAMLVGLREPASVTRRLDALAREGIEVVAQAATAIEPDALRVRSADGRWHAGDRLVVAAGIGLRWDGIEGLDAATSDAMPHAWLGRASALEFRRRFDALDARATVAIIAPPNPYRCPPGPYERATLCAWALARRGRGGKVLVCDAKDDFSKRPLFQLAWDTHYPGMVEWIARRAGGEAIAVDADGRGVRLAGGERVRADLVCAIPAQRAADLCLSSNLADDSGWCPVSAATFASTRHPRIHVIGDAAIALPMPKSAFAANSQAKLCALALLADLAGLPAPEPALVNTCYSLVSPTQAISVSGLYGLAGDRLSALSEGSSPVTGDDTLREREAVDAGHWYHSILADSFGA